ncbi:MAG: hypothetical protein ACRD4Q_00345 [Candidatus Acidiferrales bacterium]
MNLRNFVLTPSVALGTEYAMDFRVQPKGIYVLPPARCLLVCGRHAPRTLLVRRAVEYAVTIALALFSSYWIVAGR